MSCYIKIGNKKHGFTVSHPPILLGPCPSSDGWFPTVVGFPSCAGTPAEVLRPAGKIPGGSDENPIEDIVRPSVSHEIPMKSP